MNWLGIAEWFLSKGFSIIPLARCEDASNCKRPLIQWDEYQKHPPSIEEVRKWVKEFGNRLGGFAIVCGKPSGNLLVLGFEHEDAYRWFIENAPEPVKQLLENSMKVLTGVRSDGKRGVHVYVRLPAGYSVRNTDIVLPVQINASDPQKKEPLNKVEVRFDGRYVVAPGYRHYSGVDYCVLIGPVDTPQGLKCEGFKGRLDELLWYVTEEEAKQLIDYINSLAAPRQAQAQQQQVVTTTEEAQSRTITEEQIQKVIDLFGKYNAYRPGFRNHIHFYLQAWLLKAGFDPESVKALSTKLAEAFNDEEAKQRVRLVDYQVKWVREGRKALTREEIEEISMLAGQEPKVLKGRSGLVETLTNEFTEDGLPAEEARERAVEFVREVARVLGIARVKVKVIKCLRRLRDRGSCVKMLIAKYAPWLENVEVAIRTLTKQHGWADEFIAELPREIVILRDRFYNRNFYMASVDGELIISDDVDDFVDQLKNKLVSTERASKEIIGVIKKIAVRREGYISPGITEEGIVDPKNELDLTDYGIEGLIEAHRWITKYYPQVNVRYALADVAFLTAKIVSPAVKRRVKTFVDYIIWNYGRGGEGKTTLVDYVLTPLLGVRDVENSYVVIKGAIGSEAQLRNLVSLNRLPLILDEQTKDKLVRNTPMIIASAVGSGIIGLHASKHGQGFDTKFIGFRGALVFTNTTFNDFLRMAKEVASDVAIARRVINMNWENQFINAAAFSDALPEVKPVLGAVNNVFLKYRDELLKTRDLIELTEKLFTALGREYARTDEERAAIEDYIKAVREVVAEAQEERKRMIMNDEDLLVAAAYEFARSMGVQVKSVRDVIDAVLDNPSRSGIELVKAKWANEVEEIKERVLKLFGLDRDSQDFDRHPSVPNTVARALIEGKVYVRIYAGALDGRIPNTRKFMGEERIHNTLKNAYYYRLSLDAFLKPFISRLGLEEEEEAKQ